MKKAIALCIVLITVVLMSLGVNAASEKQAVFSSTSFETVQGEEFTTLIYLEAGSGIAGFDIQLKYADYVELTKVAYYYGDDASGEKENFPESVELINDNDLAENVFLRVDGQARTIHISRAGTSNTNRRMDLVKLTFRVDENLSPCLNQSGAVVGYDFLTCDSSYTNAEATTAYGDSVAISYNLSKLYIYSAGDISLDGKVAIYDPVFMRRLIARMEQATPYQIRIGDVTGDGKITIRDPIKVQQYFGNTDSVLGDRVNVTFYDMDGQKIISKSVVVGNDLINVPAVPTPTGYLGGKWSLAADSYIEPDFTGITVGMSVYAHYDSYASTYMLYYMDYLLNKYGSTYTEGVYLDSMIKYGTADSQYEAHVLWSYYDENGQKVTVNANDAGYYALGQPGYDTQVNMCAYIESFAGSELDCTYELEVPVLLKGKYATPSKAEIVAYLQKLTGGQINGTSTVSGGQIECDLNLLRVITNEQVGNSNTDYEVRLEWQISNEGTYAPISRIQRTTSSQTVDLVATLTFNGQPLEDDGKVYFDGVLLTAITEYEIRSYIISQIALKHSGSISSGEQLWNSDDRFGSTVKWESKNTGILQIANNEATVSADAVDGSSCPVQVTVTYETDEGAKTFVMEYVITVSNTGTQLVPGVNIDESLYVALLAECKKEHGATTINTNVLSDEEFVNLDLSAYGKPFIGGDGLEYAPITDLTGIGYCENLRYLNISGLNITEGISELTTLRELQTLIAQNANITGSAVQGQPVLGQLVNLKVLDLSGNGLTTLDNVLSHENVYNRLKELYLHDNDLEDISALVSVPSVKTLTLSGNKKLISQDIAILSDKVFLEYLSLADNDIDDISALSKLTMLKDLRLQNNRITSVDALSAMTKLERLYLGNNNILDVTALEGMTEMTVLYLNDNGAANVQTGQMVYLEDVSAVMFMQKLEILNVSGNDIVDLSCLAGLIPTENRTGLRELYAEDNCVRNFNFVQNLTGLEKLLLANNANTGDEASKMDQYLVGLTKLQVLTLSGKKLQDLEFLKTTADDQTVTMKPIVRLEIANCQLSSFIPTVDTSSGKVTAVVDNLETLAAMTTLKYLDISGNGLSYDAASYEFAVALPVQLDELRYLSNLQVLYADNTSVGALAKDMMQNFTNLQYLSLEHCGITDASWLSSCSKYVFVDLANNPILAFDFDYVSKNKALERLYLDSTAANAVLNEGAYAQNVLQALSLENYSISSVDMLPDMAQLRFLNLANTGMTDYVGAADKLGKYPHALSRYENLQWLDVSQTDVNIFTKANLEMLYESFADRYVNLYAATGDYAVPEGYTADGKLSAAKEGAKLLSMINNMVTDVTVATEAISNNNPDLVQDMGGYPISWTVSNTANYKIENNSKLAISSLTNVVDEELTVGATVSGLYGSDASVAARDFAVNTHILRLSDQYVQLSCSNSGDKMRGDTFTFTGAVVAKQTEGFDIPVTPVNYKVTYSYSAVYADGVNRGYSYVLDTTDAAAGTYKIKADAPLGAKIKLTANYNCADVSQFDTSRSVEMTIVAHTYTLHVNANGGTAYDANKNVITAISAVEESSVSVSATRTGHTFAGWYYDNGTFAKAFDGKMPAEDGVTIYAKWTVNPYTVTFDPNGGNAVSPSYKTITYGDDYGTLPAATRTGYQFSGWYTAKEGGSKVINTTTLTNASNHYLYAHWDKNPYTIIYNGNKPSNASSNVTGVPSNTPCKYDTDVVLGSKPSLTGWTFEGWYRDANCTTKVGDPGAILTKPNFTSVKNGEITLYAKWTPNTYNVIYYANGGSGSTSGSTFKFDTSYTLSANGFSRANHVFLGWNTSSTAVTPLYTNKQTVKNLASSGDVKLYAVWVQVTTRVGKYSREEYVGNDDEYTDTFSPGLDRQKLLANGYTQLKLTITVHGRKHNGPFMYSNDPYMKIDSSSGTELTRVSISTFSNIGFNDDGVKTYEVTLNLSALDDSCNFKIVYDTHDDPWYLGTVEITVNAK